MRPLTTTLASLGCALTGCGAVFLAGGAGAAASITSPPQTVTASAINVRQGTLPTGSQILGSRVNARRTYFGNSFAIGLGRDREGAVYPVRTGNGGLSWHTGGPALFLPTADAPLAISTVTAATKTLQYAFGGGGSVVDVTRDGGPQWRGALFPGEVVAVVPGTATNELVAFVDGGEGRSGPTWQYVTRNGGLSWTYTTATVISG